MERTDTTGIYVLMSAKNPPSITRLKDEGRGLTADEQGRSKRDVSMTRRIRREIIKHKDLSLNAHNVKIITLNGRVTLLGPVLSAVDRQAVEDAAVKVAGIKNVSSGLKIESQEAGR